MPKSVEVSFAELYNGTNMSLLCTSYTTLGVSKTINNLKLNFVAVNLNVSIVVFHAFWRPIQIILYLICLFFWSGKDMAIVSSARLVSCEVRFLYSIF